MAFAVLGVIAAALASAQQFPTPHKDPFSRLFTADSMPTTPQPRISPAPDVVASAPAPAPRTVVCGMALVPVDPNIDPKIQFKPPHQDRTPAIRILTPTVCQ
jgi:hypothetical protein